MYVYWKFHYSGSSTIVNGTSSHVHMDKMANSVTSLIFQIITFFVVLWHFSLTTCYRVSVLEDCYS